MSVVMGEQLTSTQTISLMLRLSCILVWAVVLACDSEAPISAGIEIPHPRSLNHHNIRPQSSDADYSVLLVGHAYGQYKNTDSIVPSKNLVENIELINHVKPAFIALLGDSVRAPEPQNISALHTEFAQSVAVPVLIAPGNHDLRNGIDVYEAAFGPAHYRIELESELFIVLNTWGGVARIGPRTVTEVDTEQLAFLKESLKYAAQSEHLDQVVVLMHKVVWVRLARYEGLRPLINNDHKGGFWSTIHPLLKDLARTKRVIVGAGDIGHTSYSFFVDRNPEDRITYFATGLADRESDTIVRLDFRKGVPVEIRALSLTDQEVLESAATLAGFIEWGTGLATE